MRLSHPDSRAAAVSGLRRRQTVELVARALGATQPAMVVSSLDPHCQDIHGAIAALRQARPEWFGVDPTGGAPLRALAGAIDGNVRAIPFCSVD